MLKKFDRLRQRQKPLYSKAYDLMRNTTLVLEETNMSSSNPTAFLASLLQLLQSLPASGQPSAIEMEVVAYCFAAVMSMVDIAVIQNQHSQILDAIK